jgi:hypothetical protein
MNDVYFRALESALMQCLRIADGLNTITRRGEIGTSLAVLGETVKLSSFGSFVVRKKGQRIGRNCSTRVADSVRDNPTPVREDQRPADS